MSVPSVPPSPASPSSAPALLRPALVLFCAATLLCGLAYPLLVTALGQAAFPARAAGGLIWSDGRAVGARLIGQAFTSPRYFWGRPSATTPMPASGNGSNGSNLGPSNPAQRDAVAARLAALRAADPDAAGPVPVDLVTASASGLDPDLSVAGALYQVARVARARGLAPGRVRALVEAQRRAPLLGFLGEPRVNVLALNLALDAAAGAPGAGAAR